MRRISRPLCEGSERGFEPAVLLAHESLEPRGELLETGGERGIGGGQDAHGEKPGIARAADRDGGDRDAGGICTIESRESSPSSLARGTGTPITGRVVTAASMPGRWAAPPAPAMMTRMPRPAASDPNAIIRLGVRWAETTSTSCGTPKSVNAAAASDMTLQSESDPMTTATSGATELAPEAAPGLAAGSTASVDPDSLATPPRRPGARGLGKGLRTGDFRFA